jgi:hypothetical protein
MTIASRVAHIAQIPEDILWCRENGGGSLERRGGQPDGID